MFIENLSKHILNLEGLNHIHLAGNINRVYVIEQTKEFMLEHL